MFESRWTLLDQVSHKEAQKAQEVFLMNAQWGGSV
jgi:hypothetical protein